MPIAKDLTIQELKALIEEIVEEKLRQLIRDPDEGLILRPEVQERLQRTLRQSKKSRRTIPAADVARRLGVDW